MESNYKISIPKPCHEDWNQMTPNQSGRFCNSCVKSVVDFTTMKAPEIQEYFKKNQGQRVCGRFKNEQLDSIVIQIPRDVLFSQVHFHKMFMLALLISMGTTLFSRQNLDGDKQKIDSVEVTDSTRTTTGVILPRKDSVNQEEPLMGKIDTARYDSLVKAGVKMPPLPPVPIVKQAKFVKPPKNTSPTTKGEIITSGIVSIEPYKSKPSTIDKDFVYMSSTVEVQPTFSGGLIKFYDYFKSNFKVPEEYKYMTGRLILSFVVDKDGSLNDIRVLRGINNAIDNEVIKFIKASPKWIPGEHNGEKVKVSYSLPIKITAQ